MVAVTVGLVGFSVCGRNGRFSSDRFSNNGGRGGGNSRVGRDGQAYFCSIWEKINA